MILQVFKSVGSTFSIADAYTALISLYSNQIYTTKKAAGSLGGAVIQEGLDLIELSEIAGIHHSKSRSLYAPIVLSKDTKVKLSSESFEKAILGVDSDVYPIDDMKEFEIRVCDQKRVRMIKGKKISYFKKLNSLF